MPFFWTDVGQTLGTSETDLLRLLTVAQQADVLIKEVFVSATQTTAGGARFRVARFSTPSTAGSGGTPQERDPAGQASSTTIFGNPTVGSGRTNQLTVGATGFGGCGVWRALSNEHAILLEPNGGANGNCDFIAIASAAPIGRCLPTWEE